MNSASLSRSRSTHSFADSSITTDSDITPRRRRQPLDGILDRLNSLWNLDLPRLHGSNADRLESTKTLAKRCSARLRYLSYRDVDLDQLLKSFDEQASVIFSQWKRKPHAERHVTPSRRPNESDLARVVIKGQVPALDTKQKQSLLTCLDGLLDEPYQNSRNSDSFQVAQPSLNGLSTTNVKMLSSSTRSSFTIQSTTKVTKPVTGGYSVESKTIAKLQNVPKRQSEAMDRPQTSQKKAKTVHDYLTTTQPARTVQSVLQESMPQTPTKDTSLGTSAIIPSSNDTMLMEDDTIDLFPSTQEGADILQHPDLLRSMDSGYVSASPGSLSQRLSSTFDNSKLQLPNIGLCYEFAYELQSLSLSWNEAARDLFYQVRSICRRDDPPVEERLAAYKIIADNRPYESFSQRTWQPSAGLPEDKQSSRSLYQEASLSWSQSKSFDGSPFSLRLHTPRSHQSCRFHRMFGGHRFLILNVPTWRDGASSAMADPENYQDSIAEWLCNGIRIGGRFWWPYWVEDKPKQNKNGDWYNQVHLFASTGIDLEDVPLSVKEFLNLHAPFEANIQSMNHKLFARGKLGLSKTTATVTLHKDEFLQLDDMRSNTGNVMNDGCALMSIDLGIAIAQSLGLDEVPSAFQGRISGAKGMWLIDKRNTFAHSLHGRNFWIQITPSQLKILPHPRERDCSNEVRTFDVSDWSKRLRPSSLNSQLINVLDNRGVARDVLAARSMSLTSDYYDELCESLEKQDPLLTHAWLQRHHSGKYQRTELEFVGDRPIARPDQIKLYLGAGFNPREHRHLFDLVTEALRGYLNDFVEKPRIELACSTFTYMVPDMWGILSEGEVQLCLGQAWTDPATGMETTFIAGMDGLVARNPANHPSDIQRVKFVHHPELAGYSNLIFFSTKGDRPLADYLSGGDYDGDQAFVCWDHEMVQHFQNYEPGPPDDITPDSLGLVKSSTKLSSVFEEGINDKSIRNYLKTCLSFSLRPSYLGIVTNVHVAHVYHQSLKQGPGAGQRALASCGAITLAALAAFLVDSLKQGYSLPPSTWSFLRRQLCGARELPKPAYLQSEDCIPEGFKSHNILDFLRFDVARAQKDTLLAAWWRLAKSWPAKPDEALLKPVRAFDRMPGPERSLVDRQFYQRVFGQLKVDLSLILDNWKLSVATRAGQDTAATIRAIGEVRESYRKVQPFEVPCHEGHFFYNYLAMDDEMGFNTWDRIRASYLYKHFPHSKFVWSMAGLTLCAMKAEAMGRTIPVLARTYDTMKLNQKAVKAVSEAAPLQENESDVANEQGAADEEAETQWFDAPSSWEESL